MNITSIRGRKDTLTGVWWKWYVVKVTLTKEKALEPYQ